MKTVNVRELESEFENAALLSLIPEQGSTSTFVAMVGCMLSLLAMLCA